jgi:hypothetical protein
MGNNPSLSGSTPSPRLPASRLAFLSSRLSSKPASRTVAGPERRPRRCHGFAYFPALENTTVRHQRGLPVSLVRHEASPRQLAAGPASVAGLALVGKLPYVRGVEQFFTDVV